MNGKTAIGAVLTFLGIVMVLKVFGLPFGAFLGPVFGFLFPLILIGLGVLGIKNGKKMIGGVLLAFGIIILLGKLSGVIFFLLAVGLIVWGVSMLRRKRAC